MTEEHLPWSRPGTSHDAAHALQHGAGAIRERVCTYIHTQPDGATCDEVEAALGLRHQTASARINELEDRKRIMDSGRKRKTRSGRFAIIWIRPPLTEVGLQEQLI